uniref:Uncharacterized protein n=1 Tax=Rhizophora mucronata TaxID=61149 RepID=A0A2P2QC95_RHIMU
MASISLLLAKDLGTLILTMIPKVSILLILLLGTLLVCLLVAGLLFVFLRIIQEYG